MSDILKAFDSLNRQTTEIKDQVLQLTKSKTEITAITREISDIDETLSRKIDILKSSYIKNKREHTKNLNRRREQKRDGRWVSRNTKTT